MVISEKNTIYIYICISVDTHVCNLMIMALCKAPYWKMPWRSRLRSCWWPKWCEGWAILSILNPPPSWKHEDISWCPFECASWVYVKLQFWGPFGGSLGTGTCFFQKVTCPNPRDRWRLVHIESPWSLVCVFLVMGFLHVPVSRLQKDCF